jgi:hypothetical protein
LKSKIETKHRKDYLQFCSSYELEAARSSCEQRIFWGQVGLFKILKRLIFSSSNPLGTCMIYFCQKVSYSSFFFELEKGIFRRSHLKIPTLPDKIANTNGFLRDNHIFLVA